MLHTALLAVAFGAAASNSSQPRIPAVQACIATMDGPVYHGDPTDRKLMEANVATCEKGIDQLSAIRPTNPEQGPEKLFITGRILDRAATLSYMGLGDAQTALREVKMANLYFRVAAGLPSESQNYHDAAVANVELTRQQLATLNADPLLAKAPAKSRRIAQLR